MKHMNLPISGLRAHRRIAWLLAGLLFWFVLTSCNPYSNFYPPWPVDTATSASSATVAICTEAPKLITRYTPHPTYHVKASVLEIRSAPGEKSPNVGYLRLGDLVTVYQTSQVEREYCAIWAKISPAAGPARWVCFEDLTGE